MKAAPRPDSPGAKHRKTLFIFRRDCRLRDNTGLIAALRDSEKVIPCFIFDPRQTGAHPYKSDNALQFLVGSLADLGRELRGQGARLFLFRGEAEKVVSGLIRSEGLDAVYINRDYTPFSRRRDGAIEGACREKNVAFESFGDALLNELDEVHKSDGTPYTVFTAFFIASRRLPVRPPQENGYRNYFSGRIAADEGEAVYARFLKRRNERLFRKGGRTEALRLLAGMKRFVRYDSERDIPTVDGTTGLSAHNKFGTISIREFHEAVRKRLGAGHPIIRQLYWRDFFTHVAGHFDRVFGQSFHAEYESLPWVDDPGPIRRWREGTTGFPIVDAGMRQLEATGFMHNRVRMICASFLVKDLHVDWRVGERHFATKLVDYDPAVNNGNWQWVASTGCDAAPYFRIFNPWLQQKRYDPEAAYIKRWVPELNKAAAAVIHGLGRDESQPPGGYPRPAVDHAVESRRAWEMYRRAKRAR